MATHKTPESVHEYLRIAHAFMAGSRFAPGSTVFVVASTQAPLYRVQGVFANVSEADAAADGPVPGPHSPWSREEAASRVVYEVAVPRLWFTNEVDMIEHPSWTEWPCCEARFAIRSPNDRPRFDQITAMELHIHTGDREFVYDVRKETDAIFITRGAAEMFLYPHYAAVFGHEYVERARQLLVQQGGRTITYP